MLKYWNISKHLGSSVIGWFDRLLNLQPITDKGLLEGKAWHILKER